MPQQIGPHGQFLNARAPTCGLLSSQVLAWLKNLPRMSILHDMPSKDLARTAFDALPSVTFIVDRDLKIHDANVAALTLAGTTDKPAITVRRSGEVLKCINSTVSPGGCGCAEPCRTCVLRNSVTMCLDRHEVVRGKTRFEREEVTGARDAFFLVTATPFQHEGRELALLSLDDLGEQLSIRGLVPICMHCHRVRNERNEWEDVQRYVRNTLAMDWSHGVCEPCLEKHYSE